MLGLANILSTASIHEQRYALGFDGANDSVVFGATTHNFLDFGTGNFSISLWYKADAHTTANDYILSKYQGTNDRIDIFYSNTHRIRALAKGGGTTIFDCGGSAINGLGSIWIHVLVSCDRAGNTVLYVNGTTATYGDTETTDTDTSQTLNNSAKWTVGGLSTLSSGFFEGKVSDVALFNVALDSDAAVAVYNSGKPFDLNYDRGNYDNSSALISYWRMGNGPFDNLQNGVIHDAHNPGFGNELITNGDFSTAGEPTTSTGTLGWYAAAGAGNGQEGSSITGGELVLYNDTSASHYNRVYATPGTAGDPSSINILSATLGSTYKCVYTVSEVSGSPLLQFFDGDAYNTQPSTVGTHVFYFTNKTNRLFVISNTRTTGSASTVKISNMSLVQLNGYPGLTSGATFTTDTPDD